MARPSWDDTGIAIAKVMSKRSVCLYHKVGCCFVDRRHRPLAAGYNGPPKGGVHCDKVGCAKIDGDPETGEKRRCRGAHAEMNAIMNALDSRQLEGSTLYITILPCYDCLKQLANLGLARIVYLTDYARVTPDGKAESEKEVWELAQLADIEIVKYEGRKG